MQATLLAYALVAWTFAPYVLGSLALVITLIFVARRFR